MLNIEEIKRVAIEEILAPTFELTKQYLKSNAVILENGKPVIADIIIEEDGNRADVYFPIEKERYFFVVYIDLQPKASVRIMNMSAGNRVYFFADSEENDTSDELIRMLGLNPTKKFNKGEKISYLHSAVFKKSGFDIQPYPKQTGEVESKLKALLDILEPYKENVLRLSQTASIGINIAYYGYKEHMLGIHLDTQTLSRLAELDLPLDIDLYASGPDLED